MAVVPKSHSTVDRPTATAVPPSRRARKLPKPIRVQFAGGEWQTPNMCCCCGGADPTELYSVGHGPEAAVAPEEAGDGFAFPLCVNCLAWMSIVTEIPQNRGFLFPIVASLGCATYAWYLASAAGLSTDQDNSNLVWILFGLAAALIPLAMLMYALQSNRIDRLTVRAWHLKPGPVCVLRPVAYAGRRGEGHEFVFTNPSFTAEIARLNAARVVH